MTGARDDGLEDRDDTRPASCEGDLRPGRREIRGSERRRWRQYGELRDTDRRRVRHVELEGMRDDRVRRAGRHPLTTVRCPGKPARRHLLLWRTVGDRRRRTDHVHIGHRLARHPSTRSAAHRVRHRRHRAGVTAPDPNQVREQNTQEERGEPAHASSDEVRASTQP